MGRERFKFRVWDEEAKCFASAETIEALKISLRPNGSISFQCLDKQLPSTCFEPVFCTGIKDKHGKLIYEGDILSPPGCTTHCQWIDVGWSAMGNDRRGVGLHFRGLGWSCRMEECEIIGNRYENTLLPEERYT